ncbi:MAG: radical SAM family heme chaperone HemW [Parachlamydiaceae bacterium]
MVNPSDISLYFHIPFCTKKCHYCHFFVLPDRAAYHTQLIDALCLDIDLWKHALAGKKLVSIYFGGGTPSLLEPKEISIILSYLNTAIPVDPSMMEITLEVNPETVTVDRMRAFADAGINRVSMGIQALDNKLLEKLGRTHHAKTSIDAVHAMTKAGIHNISVDLMYDIPGQTMESWRHTLKEVCLLPVTHLSLYNLTIEPQTVFFKYREQLEKELPDADCSTEMFTTAQSTLEEAGLEQYEISAFARNNLFSRHNVGYWTGRPFLGFGPSAFSYWEGKRFRAVANLNRYAGALQAGGSPIDFSEELLPEKRRRELLAIALRMRAGVDIPAFEARHGPLDEGVHLALKQLQEAGFIAMTNGRAALTDRGLLFYDTVAVELV